MHFQLKPIIENSLEHRSLHDSPVGRAFRFCFDHVTLGVDPSRASGDGSCQQHPSYQYVVFALRSWNVGIIEIGFIRRSDESPHVHALESHSVGIEPEGWTGRAVAPLAFGERVRPAWLDRDSFPLRHARWSLAR